MPLPRKERTIELPLPDKILQDLVASHLYAINMVKEDREDIIKVEVSQPDKKGMRTVKFMFIEERDCEVIKHK